MLFFYLQSPLVWLLCCCCCCWNGFSFFPRTHQKAASVGCDCLHKSDKIQSGYAIHVINKQASGLAFKKLLGIAELIRGHRLSHPTTSAALYDIWWFPVPASRFRCVPSRTEWHWGFDRHDNDRLSWAGCQHLWLPGSQRSSPSGAQLPAASFATNKPLANPHPSNPSPPPPQTPPYSGTAYCCTFSGIKQTELALSCANKEHETEMRAFQCSLPVVGLTQRSQQVTWRWSSRQAVMWWDRGTAPLC